MLAKNWVNFWVTFSEHGRASVAGQNDTPKFLHYLWGPICHRNKKFTAGLVVLGNELLPGKRLPDRNLFSRN